MFIYKYLYCLLFNVYRTTGSGMNATIMAPGLRVFLLVDVATLQTKVCQFSSKGTYTVYNKTEKIP